MYRLAIAFLLFLAAAPLHAADRKFDPEAAAKAVAPYLDDRTVAVVQVDLTRLDVDALAKQLAAVANLKMEEIADDKEAVSDALQALLKAGAKDVFLVVSLIDVPSELPFLVLPVANDADAKALLELLPKEANVHPYSFRRGTASSGSATRSSAAAKRRASASRRSSRKRGRKWPRDSRRPATASSMPW